MTGPDLDAWLAEHGGELRSVRRRIHANPELSGEEHETTRLLCDRLVAEGLDPRPLTVGTGLVCDVGQGPGPVLALRADIDALAMDDEKATEPRSRRPGVAHACGHDVHTTVVLGAGLHLARWWPADGPRLRLVFQPAEERVPGGALDVIADGGLDDVDAIYGLHCEPKLATGTVGIRRGAITSATDATTIALTGPGGHTARPELTVDLVDVAAQVAHELPRRIQERAGAEPVKVVFGAIHAGDAPNVIPTHAVLRGVVRTQSLAVWRALPRIVEEETAAIVAASGPPGRRADALVEHTVGVPPVVNDDGAVDLAKQALVDALGAANVVPAPQSWGGDDFGWYTDRVPGAYLRLGTHDPTADGPMLDLHAGAFDVDESAIEVGVRVMVAIASAWLDRHRASTR